MAKEETQFKPGQSGNPGGRPKGLAKRARELAGGDGSKALEVFAGVMLDDAAPRRDRMEAAARLLERGWGKAAQYEPVKDGDPLELDDVDRAIGAVLDELAERREAKTPGPSTNGKVAASGEAGATAA